MTLEFILSIFFSEGGKGGGETPRLNSTLIHGVEVSYLNKSEKVKCLKILDPIIIIVSCIGAMFKRRVPSQFVISKAGTDG